MSPRSWVRKLVDRKPVQPPARRRTRLAVEALEDRLVPATITVTSLADVALGTSHTGVTLRDAIQAANTDTSVNGSTAGSGADTITFDPALFVTGPATISLTQFSQGLNSDEFGPSAFRISSDVTIAGPTGNYGLTVQRDATAANFRLFYVYGGAGSEAAASLTLQNLTLSGGVAHGGNSASGGAAAGMGGAVFNRQGALVLLDTLLANNTAQGGSTHTASFPAGGAGVGGDTSSNYGSGPNAGGFFTSAGFGGGGGINNPYTSSPGGFGGGGGANYDFNGGGPGGFGGGGGSSLNGTNPGSSGFGGGTGSANSALGGGGAGMGGAIFNESGTVSITSSTLTGNSAIGGTGANNGQGLGGAVFTRNGTVTVAQSTLAGNTANEGGGAVFAVADAGGGSGYSGGNVGVALTNSILADTAGSAADFASAALGGATRTFSGTNNLIEANAGSGNGFTGGIASSADPLLGPLANNGGPTQTLAPSPGSPAVDAGSNALIPAGVSTDQRGFGRTVNTTADIGAVEMQPVEITVSPSPSVYGQGVTFTATVTNLGAAVTGGTVTFLDGNTALSGALALGGDGRASFTTATLSAGPHTMTAQYSGSLTLPAASLGQAVRRRAITVTAAPGQSKVYGTSDPGLTFAVGGAGLAGGDTVASVFSGSLHRADGKNVGTYTIDQGSLQANSNYTITGFTGANFTITPRALTITATGIDKVYDGTAAAAVALTDDRVAGDDLTASYTSASFGDKNVGTAKPISVGGIAITGADAGNYTFNTTAGATADITARPLTVTATAEDKPYDGTPAAVAHLSTDALAGDDVAAGYASALFAVAGAGPGKVVTVGGIALSGADAGNYALTADTATATAAINKADQTIAFGPLADRTFGVADFVLSAAATSGLPVSFVIVGGPAALVGGNTVHLTAAGTVTVRAVQGGDENYNAAPAVERSFAVADATAPATSGAAVSASPTRTAPTVAASVSDVGTGDGTIVAAEYFIDAVGAPGTGTAMSPADGTFDAANEGVTAALTAEQFAALSDGAHTIFVRGEDEAGNWSDAASGASDWAGAKVTFTKDTTAPTAAPSFSGTPGNNGWYTTGGAVALNPGDATAGVVAATCGLDGAAEAPYAGPVPVTGDGTHAVAYTITDAAGNVTTGTYEVRIDASAPTTTDDAPAGWQPGPVTVHLTAADQDGLSGLAGTEYSTDGQATWSPYDASTGIGVSGTGVHTVYYRSTDNAGNVEGVRSFAVRIDTFAPTAAGFTKSGDEDHPIAFAAADFAGAFTDLDGDPLAAVRVESLPAHGALTLGGADVNVDDVIPVGRLDALTFTPDTNWSGADGFTYSASDGARWSDAAAVTITVKHVEAPGLVVDTTDDTSDRSDDRTSLREAIAYAGTLSGHHDITFAPGVAGTIDLTAALPQLTGDVSVVGPGADVLTVQRDAHAGTDFGLFVVHSDATAAVSGLTLRGGTDTAVYNSAGASLTLDAVVVRDNHVTTTSAVGTAGVFNLGALTVRNSTVADNVSTGGLHAAGVDSETGSVEITNSTVSGNESHGTNSAGGIGIYGGTAVIDSCTITGNVADNRDLPDNRSGGGLDVGVASVTLSNTILAGNTSYPGTADPDVRGDLGYEPLVGTLVSGGHNLIGRTHDATPFGATDLVGALGAPVDPLLAPLGAYGGPTPTVALLPGSPAIGAGAATAADQRGVARDAAPDIGAFESQGFTIAVTSGDKQSTPVSIAFAAPLVVTVASAHGEPVAGGRVTFTAPGFGASATFAASPATVAGDGTAQTTAAANWFAGANYAVTADARGANAVAFTLSNRGGGGGGQGPAAPVLGPIGPKAVDEQAPLTFTVSATDPDTPAGGLTFSAINLPAGATFDPATRAFAWTPTEDQDGTYTVTFAVSDGTRSDQEAVTITVAEVNRSPALAPIPALAATAGATVAFTAAGSDPDAGPGARNRLTYSLVGAPAGAAIDPTSGAFAWTTTESTAPGVYAFTVRVTDNGGLFAERAVTVVVAAGSAGGGDAVSPQGRPAATPRPASATGSGIGTPGGVVVYDASGAEVWRLDFSLWLGGLTATVADVTGDGIADVLVGTMTGRPLLVAFDGATGTMVGAVLAYPRPDVGGVLWLGTMDLTGDGRPEVIALGAGWVSVFDPLTGLVIALP
ncbi:MAG: Ig-like domain repeat protein [Planctomycetes bacterium]|nr:Ig-like domain repeat protein [Planctomycetota bacterium]